MRGTVAKRLRRKAEQLTAGAADVDYEWVQHNAVDWTCMLAPGCTRERYQWLKRQRGQR
jgi:hypothetical protein